jgi:hypothetical protein
MSFSDISPAHENMKRLPPLRPFSKLRTSLFQASYSPARLGEQLSPLCQDTTHPRHLSALKKFQSGPTTGLQWMVYSTARARIRPAVVRNWVSRRFEGAALEVLRERGLTWDGHPQSHPPSAQVDERGELTPLTGTISIALGRGMITAKWSTVKEEATMAIDAATEACQRESAQNTPVIRRQYDRGYGIPLVNQKAYGKGHGFSSSNRNRTEYVPLQA